ncbi:MAG: NAD(P)H-hydrate dehydratase [Candidatus Omnitrophica bacterium]|nr:NAD(P)H-hydrate dehydratase [Candidatus Omnitrophota bacterium]
MSRSSGNPAPFSLLRRRPDTHKGDYGHVLVVGGSIGMVGAPILTATAALRSGAGLVTLAVPDSIYTIVARKAPPEIMVQPLPHCTGTFRPSSIQALRPFLAKTDVLALGPGLSHRPEAQGFARRLLAVTGLAVVMDADGINAFAGPARKQLIKRKGPLVLTPHPGEMARLLGVTIPAVQHDRARTALKAAKELNAVVVLKGNRTVVADPAGHKYVNTTGNPGMATAGVGDVLTGVIAALIGQGLDPFAAARAGVYVHGLAGDLAARKTGEISLTAGDVLDYLPSAFKRFLR